MKKSYLVSILICSILSIFYYYSKTSSDFITAREVYQVYLEGNVIGFINNDQELYDLINDEQKEIKDIYNVDYVYPPSDFEIVKINSYVSNITDANEIYSMIEGKDNFTIKGYEINISSDDEEVEEVNLYVLDKEIFENAISTFVAAYIDDSLYLDYISGEQPEIVNTGFIITSMFFSENISIQEAYISVEEKIYTDESDLLQYLIFGDNAEILEYKVTTGDTIASIADENQLSISEFLISNPSYRDQDTMLLIGTVVNVTLQNPALNFVYVVKEIEELETDYVNTNIYDDNYSSSYSEVTTQGVTGLNLVTMEYEVTNGITSQEVVITNSKEIREVVNQITTKGVSYGSSSGSSSYGSDGLYTGLSFTSPINAGFIVTSEFGVWRGSYKHTGTDFSGTGYNSNIYAIASGTVTQATEACSSCSSWQYGTFVVISHGNNFYSIYMHMVVGSLKVKIGDSVAMGQAIGGMGSTGNSTGVHLHLGFSEGEPNTSSAVTYYDPYPLIFGS